jgi:hypothetical protein
MRLRNTPLSGLCFLALAGCNLLTSGPSTPDVKPEPDKAEEQYVDADYYAFMAKMLEADQYNTSDQIVAAAEKLKATGTIKDLSRLDSLRKKRIDPIRAADKPAILKALKGE